MEDQIYNIMDHYQTNSIVSEPILDEKNARFCLYPIVYTGLWNLYKKQQSSFWKAEEIDFSEDYKDWEKLNSDEKHVIKMILAFFANTDGIVNLNINSRLLNNITINEAKVTYNFQMMMENVHCVSGDTLILTDDGYFKILDLLDKDVNVWNGKEFTSTTIKFTGKSKLYCVKLSNGIELKCTPEHKWFIKNNLNEKEIIFTKDLKENDIIYPYELPIMDINDPDEFMNPHLHGFFCGDEVQSNNLSIIYLSLEKEELLEYFESANYEKNDNYIKLDISDKINKNKFFVPINYSINTKIKWLEGIFHSCIDINKKNNNLEIFSINYDFIKNIQLLLTTLNIKSNIISKDNKFLININNSELNKLLNLGFKSNKKIDLIELNNTNFDIYINQVTILDSINDTYCFTEPKEHAGIFNGCLTGQSETYTLMLDNLIKDKTEKEYLFNSITTIPSIKKISDWALKWIDSDTHIANRIVAFACIEGIMFSGAFATIFWLKKYKGSGTLFMKGLVKSNEFISRDEGLHAEFACELFKLIVNKPPKNEIINIITESVEIASEFINESIKCKLVGLNSNLMTEYIKYVADRLIVSLGYEKYYKVTNPFSFMETIGMVQKTNFHEQRVTEYQSAYNANTSREFASSEDF